MPNEASLKRESAGRYLTRDGRFVVEQSSGRWMLVDAESTDDLGLPLVRGPFATLDEARNAIEAARSGPAPTSNLADRIGAIPRPTKESARPGRAGDRKPSRAPGGGKTKPPPAPRPPKIALRDVQPGDGAALRALLTAAGLDSRSADERTLAAFARRNPGLLVVATADDEIVASALAGWDGRRGWLYDVATAQAHRRKGIATRLVRRVEGRLRALGCASASVTMPDDADGVRQFWAALGYEPSEARALGKPL